VYATDAAGNFQWITPVGAGPRAVVASPDGSRIYVRAGGLVYVIDTEFGQLITTVAVGNTGAGMAISPDGGRVYVVNDGAPPNTVSVIDTASNLVTATVALGSEFVNVSPQEITASNSRVWVAEKALTNPAGPGVVGRFSGAGGAVGTPITGFNTPYAVAVSGNYLWVTDYSANTVTVLDVSANDNTQPPVVFSVSVGDDPDAVAVSADGTRGYVVDTISSSVYVIDFATQSVLTILPVPLSLEPVAIAISPDGTRAYVTSDQNNTVTIIDTAAGGAGGGNGGDGGVGGKGGAGAAGGVGGGLASVGGTGGQGGTGGTGDTGGTGGTGGGGGTSGTSTPGNAGSAGTAGGSGTGGAGGAGGTGGSV
jgi:YVTN family beta-propeller protein